jgi:hypothetical protein
MAQNRDYIPWNDDALFTFARQVHNYSLTCFSAWSVPSTRDFQYTEADQGRGVDYAAAYENEGTPRGPGPGPAW